MGKKIAFYVAAASAMVLLFQNCGKSGFESQSQLDSLNSSSSDSKVTSAPFPWDPSVNFITHMSCPNVNQYQGTNNPFFTFRMAASDVGAFRVIRKTLISKGLTPNVPDIADAGLTFRTDFLDYMDKNFPRTTDHATPATIQSVLTSNSLFQNTQVQLTFRNINDLSQWGLRGDGSVIAYNAMDKLGTADFAKALTDKYGQMVNWFPVKTESKRNFRGQLHAAAAPANFDDTTFIRSIDQGFYLHLGFSQNTQLSSSNIVIKGIGPVTDDQSRLYGRGFRFLFGAPNDAVLKNVTTDTYKLRYAASNPPLGISTRSISEWDTSTSGGPTQLTSQWACFSYAIVRPEDAVRCPREDVTLIKRDELDVIRKTLPADEFDVNTTLRCVVPTSYAAGVGSCYINSAANHAKEPAYPMYFGNPSDLTSNTTLAAYLTTLRVNAGATDSTYTANDYPDVLDTGSAKFFNRTGVEYRYYTHTCAQTRERQCVNFANFCYKLK